MPTMPASRPSCCRTVTTGCTAVYEAAAVATQDFAKCARHDTGVNNGHSGVVIAGITSAGCSGRRSGKALKRSKVVRGSGDRGHAGVTPSGIAAISVDAWLLVSNIWASRFCREDGSIPLSVALISHDH
jgi:hypothetical protein